MKYLPMRRHLCSTSGFNERRRSGSLRAALHMRRGMALACLCAWLLAAAALGAGKLPAVVPAHYLPFHFSSFSDSPEVFTEAFAAPPRANARVGAWLPPEDSGRGVIRAGIVSHHLLIKDLIADFFRTMALSTKPRTIVVLGPNHRDRGQDRIAVARLPWKTPFGMLPTDEGLVDDLVRQGLAAINEDAFFDEHSVGALVPFIRHYFPRTRVVCLIVRPDAAPEACFRLGRFLAGYPGGRVLVLGSLDFSHYKASARAQADDEATWPVLQSLDPAWAGSAVVDSRAVLRAVLSFCQAAGTRPPEVVHHTDSGLLSGEPDVPCTSYYNLFFRRKCRY
jgi:MEMO1 family protein